MKIIIPMSGRGQRFIDKGYTVPKPLIEVDGMPIIEHIVRQFDPEDSFLFICANDHLETTPMRSILQRIAPNGTIIGIAPHKLGPVHAVQQVYDYIDDEEEVIVNYCDFGWYWNYGDFKRHTHDRKADGAVPAYRGFHPHMLGTTNYAFMRDKDQWMLEIREKQPFTNNRMAEYASSGTYYFRTGGLMKHYMDLTVARGLQVKGEYYVSVVYNLLVEDGLKVSIYEIQHMLQWGTPEDVEDYLYHSDYFKKLMQHHVFESPLAETIQLIPLAGEGMRFQKEGYETPKPLLPLSGRTMIEQAFDCYPKAAHERFVVLQRHCDAYGIDDLLKKHFPKARIIRLDHVTEGQAITASLGLEAEDSDRPLLVAACDNGLLIDEARYTQALLDPEVDGLCFSFRNNPTVGKNPNAYGYLETDSNDRITGVSVKKPISDCPMSDHAIVGAFFFKKTSDFFEALSDLVEANRRVNGEFYIDNMMGVLAESGKCYKAFEVPYESWGTPNDYKTYQYWQSFFHKAFFHPYAIDGDPMVPDEEKEALIASVCQFSQPNV
jgi:NDP-sugar pyrophosphorylase family protein